MAESPAQSVAEPVLGVYHLNTAPRLAASAPSEAPELAKVQDSPILRENAIWFCRLRWIVVAVLTVGGIAALAPGQLARLGLAIHPIWLWAPAGILAGLNLLFTRLASQTTAQHQGDIFVRRQLWTQIVCDLLVLTVVVLAFGSRLPAGPFMYLFHIVLGCIVFSRGASLGIVGFAATLYLMALGLDLSGVHLPAPRLDLQSTNPETADLVNVLFQTATMFLVWLVIWYLVSEVAERLRRYEDELVLSNHRLEVSSADRAAHMLQTTHQLKAPFAAIHAQAQLLLGGYCGELTSKARGVVEKMSARCLSLSRQIQEMLQLANLRSKGQSTLAVQEIDLAEAVEATISRIEPTARQRMISIQRDLGPVEVEAALDHLTMLLDNLVVNAVHYSHDRGSIDVQCRATGPDRAVFQVRDHGIGIPPEKLPRIFEDYFHTDEAVRHNPASTGLGLAIVRQIAQEANIAVQVESAPGWGTQFTVTIPRFRTQSSNPPHAR